MHFGISRQRTQLITALLFFSGAAGLAYEVSWSRQLGLVFGQTARAAAIVLGAYFLGMAVGYAIAGRLAARLRRPLLGFAMAEVGAGLWALFVPLLLRWAPPSVADSPTRLGVALLVLLPGTTALGASLPFVAQALGGKSQGGGVQAIARAYAFNLAGAVVGVACSTGFLAAVGVTTTSYLAACLSICVGLAAWMFGRLSPGQALPKVDASDEGVASESTTRRTDTLWIGAAAVSGLGTLASQVLYMRLFSLIFHNSTYTFAAILLVVLLSLALASLLGAWSLKRFDPRALLAAAALTVAGLLPLSVLLFVRIGQLRYFSLGDTFWIYILGAFALVALVICVPVLAMGLILPLSWQLAGANDRPGRVMGRLTTANTVAGAVGALGTSFVFLPVFDLWWSFAVVAAAYLVLALLVIGSLSRSFSLSNAGWPKRRWLRAAGFVFVLGLVSSVGVSGFTGVASDEVLVQRFTGPYGWVDVTREGRDNLHLRHNVHYGMGSSGSGAMELRQGHLPLLLHPDPQRVAFIGLATGTTASAALDIPEVERITVMELLPEVVAAAHLFAKENAQVLSDPKVEIIVGDGRNILGAASERHDVIVSDLFVPWESKTGYLYTVEHYAAVHERLNEGGLFCQWLAGWQLGPSELDTIAQSMKQVFAHVAIWQVSRSERRPLFALVGVDQVQSVSRARLEERLQLRRSPVRGREQVLRTADDVVGWYQGDWVADAAVALNTDEHPVVEFSAPVTHRSRGQRLKLGGFWSYHDQRLSSLRRRAFLFDPPARPEERKRPRRRR